VRRCGAPVALALGFFGCGLGGPVVTVQHQLGARVVVRNVRYSGCVWPAALQPGAFATPPKTCLPGAARVYFERLDLDAPTSTWAGFQSAPVFDPPGGEDVQLALTPDAIEPDLTAPGPFGH
jgi:hypothetical protein